MKKILPLLLLLTTLAALAQTPPPEPTPGFLQRIIRLNTEAESSTNWIFALAPSYAPGLKNSHGERQELGFTGALLYPISKYAFAGMRADYLAGDFFLPSVGVEMKADLILFGKLRVTPFAVSGVSYPVSGAGQENNALGAIYGAGLKTDLYRWKNGHLGAFYEAEKWTQFSGVTIHHFGALVSWTF